MDEKGTKASVLEKIQIASRKKRRKRLLLLLIPTLVILIVVGAYLVYRFYSNIREELTLEAGSKTPAVEDFLYDPDISVNCNTDLEAVNMRKPGDHTIDFSWLFLHAESKLSIRDTTAPVAETEDLMVKVGDKPRPKEFLLSYDDVTEISVSYANEPDVSEEGIQNVSIRLEDLGGNVTLLQAKLTVYDETKVPVINGADDRTIYTGESITYRNGITVEDALDPDPVLTIDNSAVNQDVPGVYPVTYTATDFCGRSSNVTIKVHVEEKPANYQDVEMLYSKADERLRLILKDGMTDIEKAFAIFRWTRLEIPWIQTGSHENDADQAILGLEGNSGDCYTHALVCKILMERAGFLSVMIEKNTETGTHYWLKVNVDGNWYNMDPSPIYIRQFIPFLATDQELKAWADKWRPHLYELKENPYPATPLVSPVSVEYKDGDYILTVK